MANPTGKGGFQPGRSGNPGGRKRGLVHLQAEARRYTAEALRTLLGLMRAARSEGVRLSAAEVILDRGWGKAVQALQVDTKFAEKKLSELNPAELQELEERLSLDVQGQGDMFNAAGTGEGSGRTPGSLN